MADNSLRARAVRGGLWLGVGGGGEQGLRLLRNMILARMLAPEAFGIMAIVIAINAALESFTQVGIVEAIVQDPDSEDEVYLNGAWWLSLARSAALVIIGMVGSIWLAGFYHIPEQLGILRLSFCSLLFNGATSARAYIALKNMDYRKWAIISHGGGICGIALSLVLSLHIPGVAALVIGLVGESLARCFLSYLLCPYIPGIKFSAHHMRRLLTYARGMFGLPILYLVYAQAPVFVIGKLMSQGEVGLYSLATSLAIAPVMFVMALINQILMPAFSSRQEDKTWLNMMILKISRIIGVVGFPLALFVAMYARDLLTIVYGASYSAASVPFALAFLSALLGTYSSPIVNVYLAIGQPNLHRLFAGIRAILVLLTIYHATAWYGITGAAAVITISMLVSCFFQVNRLHKLTGLDMMKYGYSLLLGVGATAIVPVVWYLTYDAVSPLPTVRLAAGFIGCALTYGTLVLIYGKDIKKCLSLDLPSIQLEK